jgi:hypothetical protein
VDLVVSRVLPDVLVFDGEVPDSSQSPPAPPSLPDPLPERAFGHIRPKDWLKSLSARDKSEEGEGAAYAVTAKIVDVPLEVLPGRQKEFSNFVSKVCQLPLLLIVHLFKHAFLNRSSLARMVPSLEFWVQPL